jgi:hypothetical protein
MDNPSILTYEQYQEKIKNLKNPADVANFAQELIAPLLAQSQPEPVVGRKLGRPRLQPFARKLDRVLTPPPTREVSEIRKPQLSERDIEEKVISLYGKGLTTRDITSHLKDTHDIDMATSAVSSITDKVFPLVKEWQSRPLASLYPILYMDGLWFKVRDAGKIVSKCAYIAMGINEQGYKEVLGIWISETEGAKLWLQILGELKNRGVESVLIACVDGLIR